MSFPRYPDCENSGVEWIGDVPRHWSSAPLRWLTRRYSGGTPDRSNPSYWEDGTVPWINSGAVNDRTITEPSAYITELALEHSAARWIPPDALVMALAGQGRTKGMVAQVTFRTTCNQSMAVIIPGPSWNSRYLFWWLDANYQNIRNMAGGDLRDGLNLDLLASIKCPLAPVAEQLAIAAFLDRETARIDALVAEQERLIELLREKRQAVISHAVTKGLDPTVPMKDSGVEWLGEVPAHWRVTRVKACTSFITSGPRGWSDRISDDGALFVQSGDLDDKLRIDFANAKRVQVADDAESMRTRLRVGDVVVCITGAKTGNVSVCTTLIEAAYVNQHLCLLRPTSEVEPRFLGMMLKGLTGREHFARSQYGLKQGLSLEDVHECPIVIPPLEEQAAILAHLDKMSDRLDALEANVASTIVLLGERRAALISAAVTGQIDVRGLAHESAA